MDLAAAGRRYIAAREWQGAGPGVSKVLSIIAGQYMANG